MTRLRWWCIGLLLTALAGCDLPQVVLVCERDALVTYRSEPEPEWVEALVAGSWVAVLPGRSVADRRCPRYTQRRAAASVS